jgi:hypothetical protein
MLFNRGEYCTYDVNTLKHNVSNICIKHLLFDHDERLTQKQYQYDYT